MEGDGSQVSNSAESSLLPLSPFEAFLNATSTENSVNVLVDPDHPTRRVTLEDATGAGTASTGGDRIAEILLNSNACETFW